MAAKSRTYMATSTPSSSADGSVDLSVLPAEAILAYADRVAAIENPMAVPSDKQLPLWHLAQDLLDWLIDERAELAAQVEDLSETNRRLKIEVTEARSVCSSLSRELKKRRQVKKGRGPPKKYASGKSYPDKCRSSASPAYAWSRRVQWSVEIIQRTYRGYRGRKMFQQLVERLVYADLGPSTAKAGQLVMSPLVHEPSASRKAIAIHAPDAPDGAVDEEGLRKESSGGVRQSDAAGHLGRVSHPPLPSPDDSSRLPSWPSARSGATLRPSPLQIGEHYEAETGSGGRADDSGVALDGSMFRDSAAATAMRGGDGDGAHAKPGMTEALAPVSSSAVDTR